MKDQQGIISLLIKNKYENIKNFYINSDSNDIYDLIPHSFRYTALKYILKLASLPLTTFVAIASFFTLGSISFKHFNIGEILLNKMNQSISKKILHGLPEENEEDCTIPEIVEHLLKNHEKTFKLIAEPEDSLIKKFSKYIPDFSKLVNFWEYGGINYFPEIQEKQPIIDLIYKKIISAVYNAGKKGKKFEISDIKALFPQVDFEAGAIKVDDVACKQPTIEQPIEQTVEPITVEHDPLTNLAALCALSYIITKITQEHFIAEYIYDQNKSAIPYLEYSELHFPKVLGYAH